MSGTAGPQRSLAWYVAGLADGSVPENATPRGRRTAECVQRKAERSVWQVAEGRTRWFAKCGRGGKAGEIRGEAVNARALHAAGLGPSVLASGAYGGGEWVVTADAGVSLLDGRWRERDASALAGAARVVRRLHDGGWSFPDLQERHVRVGDGPGPVLIDVARLERHRGAAPAKARARDLAALLFSLPLIRCDGVGGVTVAERVRLVRDASGARGDALRSLLVAIDAEIGRLATRTRWRRGYFAASAAFSAELRRIARGGESPCDVLLSARGATVVRTLPDRENRTIGRDDAGRPLFFVKAFPPTQRGFSPAMEEVAAIDLFLRNGIPVNRVAGYAEDVERGSVVTVAACAGEPLDDLLRRGVTPAERRALAIGTARIWRRMRLCGLRHRDAYACHVFAARTAGPARFDLRLIDLTRAGRAPWPKERWFVKDAAQLWHGVRPAGATATDAVRWLRAYFGVPRLTREAKRFAAKVASKERAISARQERKTRRGSGAR